MKFDSSKWDITNILAMEGSKKLALQPDFQRFYIWPNAKERSLIDSILRGYPIPSIWIWSHKGRGGKTVYEVIDGQQRLTCIKRFINNEYSFKSNQGAAGAEDLSKLDGAFYDKVPAGEKGVTLSQDLRNKIMDYMIPYVSVETDDKPLIIDIFKRLNISATNLNPQEMRNAFYNGKFKSAVYELAGSLQEDKFWGERRKVFSKPTSDRMANQQFVSELFVAMLEKEIQDKSNKVNEYYEDYDENFRANDDIVKRFKATNSLIKEVTRENSRYTSNTSDFYTLFLILDELLCDKSIRMDAANKSAISRSLEEFSDQYDQYNERRRGGETEGGVLETYRETIVGRQREKEIREIRDRIIRHILDPGIKRISQDPVRRFTDEQRNFIWYASAEKLCGICDKPVERYDDYEPDHVKPWISGGLTTINNGQIAHITCNRKKQDKVQKKKRQRKKK